MTRESNVLFVGSPYWCRYLRDTLYEYAALPGFVAGQFFRWLPTGRRRICLVGIGPADSWKRRVYYSLAFVMARLGFTGKPVIYWIGSDVLRLQPGRTEVARCRNLAGSDWLAEEVSDAGYTCESILFPVRSEDSLGIPFPNRHRLQVLCYIPDTAPSIHGGEAILHAARRCEGIDFNVIGGAGLWCDSPPANLRFLGWVNQVADHLAEAHVVVRMTQHDSFSAFVREGLLSGRHVIFTYPVAGAIHVESDDVQGLVAALRRLGSACEAGRLVANQPPAEMLSMLQDTRGQAVALANELC